MRVIPSRNDRTILHRLRRQHVTMRQRSHLVLDRDPKRHHMIGQVEVDVVDHRLRMHRIPVRLLVLHQQLREVQLSAFDLNVQSRRCLRRLRLYLVPERAAQRDRWIIQLNNLSSIIDDEPVTDPRHRSTRRELYVRDVRDGSLHGVDADTVVHVHRDPLEHEVVVVWVEHDTITTADQTLRLFAHTAERRRAHTTRSRCGWRPYQQLLRFTSIRDHLRAATLGLLSLAITVFARSRHLMTAKHDATSPRLTLPSDRPRRIRKND